MIKTSGQEDKNFTAKVSENRLINIKNTVTGEERIYNVLDFIPGQRHYRAETAEYPVYLQNDIYNQMKKYHFVG